MKRLLLPLLAALAFPTAVNANVDPEVHKLCLPAADYLGCVKAMSTKSTDVPNLRVIQGEIELTGNSCPTGFAYKGAGYCQKVLCGHTFGSHPDLKNKGHKLINKGNLGCFRGVFSWGSQIVKAVQDPKCPLTEPIIGTQSSCFTQSKLDEIKSKKKKKPVKVNASTGSVPVNCDSPVWKNKPRCNL